MKVLILFLASGAVFGQTKPAPKPAAKSAYPKEVPKDAERLSDYEWRWVDKSGKAWIFRQTPFSVAKFPEEAAKSETASRMDAGAPVKARDLGDSVEFTRKSPFGVSTWVKKKSELNEIEKSAWEAASKKKEQE